MVDIIYRNCVVCTELYIPQSTDQKVCSRPCRVVHRQNCQTANRAARNLGSFARKFQDLGVLKCPECSRNTPRRDPQQVWCSSACKADTKMREAKLRLRARLEALGIEWRENP